MKRAISSILVIFLSVFVCFSAALAEDFAPEVSCSASIEEKMGLHMKTFFQKLREGDTRAAYYMTQITFRSYPYSEFKEIAAGTGLSDYVSMEWLDFKIDPPSIFLPRTATLTGEFILADGATHTLQFALVKEDGVWKVRDILETPLVSYFKKIFPSGTQLKKKIVQEIEKISTAMRDDKYYPYYKTLSKEAKAKVSLSALKAALLELKARGADLSISNEDDIQLDDCMPRQTGNGIMRVKGKYNNAAGTVNFTFDYKYEWIWRVNGLDIKAAPLQ